MAYDPQKDKELACFDLGEIIVTVQQYNGGDKKVQLSRRFGENGKVGRAGRLLESEFRDIVSIADNILAVFDGEAKKKKTKKAKGKSK